MTVFLTPDQRPFFAGTYFPPDGPLRPARVPRPPHPDRRAVARQPRRARARRRRARRRTCAETSEPAAGRQRSARTSCRRLAAQLAATSTPDWGGFGRAPKFPPSDAAPAAPAASTAGPATRHALAMVTQDARRHGPGRHVRPDRRRLRPLLHRRALAGPPLREDALRQRAPRARLPGGLSGHRRSVLRAGSPARSSTTSCAR